MAVNFPVLAGRVTPCLTRKNRPLGSSQKAGMFKALSKVVVFVVDDSL
jgi:hypothetical protein